MASYFAQLKCRVGFITGKFFTSPLKEWVDVLIVSEDPQTIFRSSEELVEYCWPQVVEQVGGRSRNGEYHLEVHYLFDGGEMHKLFLVNVDGDRYRMIEEYEYSRS